MSEPKKYTCPTCGSAIIFEKIDFKDAPGISAQCSGINYLCLFAISTLAFGTDKDDAYNALCRE